MAFRALVFLLLLGPCAGTAQTAQTTTKLEIISGLPIVSGVFVDGRGPYKFLLDTAGQANEMDADLARKLGLTPTFQREMRTPTESSLIKGTTVNEVRLGTMSALREDFLFVSPETLHGLPVHGVLGQAFLRHYDYTLDYRHRRITFGGPPPDGTRIDFQLAYACMVIPTNLGGMLLDSGSNNLFLFRPHSELTTIAVMTAAGKSTVSVDFAPVLRIAGKEYRRESAAYHAVPNAPAAGLLPATLFHAIYVSNSDGYVILDPQ